MFSFGNPFVESFTRPKSSFGNFFDDEFVSPFSNYYAREQPSLFRSSSFRQPSYQPSYQPSSFLNVPSYQKNQQYAISEDEEDQENDLFSDFFGLRRPVRHEQPKKEIKSRNDECKSNKPKSIEPNNAELSKESQTPKEIEQTHQPAQTTQQQLKRPKNLSELRQMKLGKSALISQDKVLDSTRFDTDSEVEFRFNYKCSDPSGIDIRITKDDYIELKTKDGYNWKNKLPDNVEVSKASCTLVNNRLTLRLPKKSIESVKTSPAVEFKCPKLSANKTKEAEKTNKREDEEFDPDAPIVEDIIEDDY